MSVWVLAVIVGLVFVLAAGFMLSHDVRLVARGQRTQGRVASWSFRRGDGRWEDREKPATFAPVLRFQTAGGEEVEATASVRSGTPVAVVAALLQLPVGVIYDPDNPRNADISFLMWPMMIFETLFILAGIGIAVFGVTHLIR